MLGRTYWTDDATPIRGTIDRLLYDIRKDDGSDGLIFDAVSEADVLEEAEEILSMDALTSPYGKLERKMQILLRVMDRSASNVKPLNVQITQPFRQRGVVQVAAIFELSDGQTVSIYFHNPDTTPQKLAPTDEMVSWKWLLNKKDITIVVAPERGEDLNVNEVGRRVMKLAEKNSAAFQRANARRAERMQKIQQSKDEVAALQKELAEAQADLEVAKERYLDSESRLTDAKKAADEAKKRREEEQKAREEAERKAKEEAERQAAAKAEADRRAAEEEAARKAAEEETKRKAAEEAEAERQRQAEEEAKAQAAAEEQQPEAEEQKPAEPDEETPSATDPEPEAEPAPEPQPEAAPQEHGNTQRDADIAILQSVINRTHPDMTGEGALNDVLEIATRLESSPDEELSELVAKATEVLQDMVVQEATNVLTKEGGSK